MRLGDLLDRTARLVELAGAEAVPAALRERHVTGIEYDSRRVTPDAIFFALRGKRHAV